MKLKKVSVKNFRCIKDESLDCDNLTVFVGPNGSGKSSFLRAIEYFYDSNYRLSEDDFYNGDNDQEISVEATYSDLTPVEKEKFSEYIDNDQLTIEKVCNWHEGRAVQKYYGQRFINSEFDQFRNAAGGNLRREYEVLRDKYPDLPVYNDKDQGEEALRAWEAANHEVCVPTRDNGNYFGFGNVGGARLEQHTKYILVPAVRDASSDSEEGKDSILTEIMDLVVRRALAARKDIEQLRVDTNQRYQEIIDPNNLEELSALEGELNATLTTYAGNASARIKWNTEDDIDIPLPNANITLVEDEYEARVEKTGHGLQRAFILTMVQHLALIQNAVDLIDEEEEYDGIIPNLLLAVEEPELFQHPSRQRNIAGVLHRLANEGIPGVAQTVQVLYATHSPLFVGLEWFGKIRLFKKKTVGEGLPRHTRIVKSSIATVLRQLENAFQKPVGSYDEAALMTRLKAVMTPWMNEGFFADAVVLVEGEEDRAVILAMAEVMEINFDNIGISVIPCMGKNNLDRPTLIFRSLDIPAYVIWDCDRTKGEIKANHALLRINNRQIEDFPEFVADNCACFAEKLTAVFRNDCGQDLYDSEMQKQTDLLQMTPERAEKRSSVITEIIKVAAANKIKLERFREIVNRIIALRG